MTKIVHPLHYQIYQRQGTRWFVFEQGRVFYNPGQSPVQLEHVERQYGLSEEEVIIELFRINGGKPGYYLANLRSQRYYYCGANWKDIQTTLLTLGIGRAEAVGD